ncbi:MAG: hypothetical protein UFV24_05300 [Dorea sp.]|uniref:hypothetical protein n=1 Tax=Dorea sp. TaxID=2040332 RepID=UPI002E7880D6|nr:hypothetical protein [Dorea sp.]MED9704184.1 hypothetical protein [Dorea sp.]
MTIGNSNFTERQKEMSMLSAVRPISRCLPVYWFITAVDLLSDYRTLDAGMRTELYTA